MEEETRTKQKKTSEEQDQNTKRNERKLEMREERREGLTRKINIYIYIYREREREIDREREERKQDKDGGQGERTRTEDKERGQGERRRMRRRNLVYAASFSWAKGLFLIVLVIGEGFWLNSQICDIESHTFSELPFLHPYLRFRIQTSKEGKGLFLLILGLLPGCRTTADLFLAVGIAVANCKATPPCFPQKPPTL